jgi:hypothetical protein
MYSWAHGRTGLFWVILAALAILGFYIAHLLVFLGKSPEPFGIDELQGLLD